MTGNPSAGRDGPFVYPGSGVDRATPVWGIAKGIQVGLAATPGPRGLLRIYTPYLSQEFPRVVNFISIEPTVAGNNWRSQSELAQSKASPGQSGLDFYPSNEPERFDRSGLPPQGVIDQGTGRLTLFVHTETFPDGSRPMVALDFDPANPYEFGLTTYAAEDSAEMTSCVLSATMGNYGLLRCLRLADRTVTTSQLWSEDEDLNSVGFFRWRTFPASELERTTQGYYVEAWTDTDVTRLEYHPDVNDFWHYIGKPGRHSWRADAASKPELAINARSVYWNSQAQIPGGVAIENFELRTEYQAGEQFWFGVQPDD
jgi:hypothetical protein